MQPRGLYGSSEVQALFSIAEGENRLLGGGVPVSDRAQLAIRDPDTGNALAAGASGELWIDAPSRFVEYLDNPSPTERAVDADGMFRTGDLARLADAGFVYEARMGDAIRLGGFLVSPEGRSRRSFRRSPASRACRSFPPRAPIRIRCRWRSFAPPRAQFCRRTICARFAGNNWRGSKCRRVSSWWMHFRPWKALTASRCKKCACARWPRRCWGKSGTTSAPDRRCDVAQLD
jgi:hypothetical protein